ncbi:hypothetical protein [Nocardioides sp.]|jgi:hypothetical protein|uniref:hypothetical protein n=1 Tax=Nocardioides sp. TaxID=35761 RepID=UPI002F411286
MTLSSAQVESGSLVAIAEMCGHGADASAHIVVSDLSGRPMTEVDPDDVGSDGIHTQSSAAGPYVPWHDKQGGHVGGFTR